MAQPTRLQDLLTRIDPARRRALVDRLKGERTRPIDAHRDWYELILCVLLESRGRLARSRNALERSNQRLIRTADRLSACAVSALNAPE
jgi:hypothetical protein